MNTQQERKARMEANFRIAEARLRELIARRKGGMARLFTDAAGFTPDERVCLLLDAAVLMGRHWRGTAWTAKEAALLDSWEDAPRSREGKALRRARRRLCRLLLARR